MEVAHFTVLMIYYETWKTPYSTTAHEIVIIILSVELADEYVSAETLQG